MKTITQKIKEMIALPYSNAEIKRALPKATIQQIYNQRYQLKKRTGKKAMAAMDIDSHSSGGQFDIPKKVKNPPANAVQVGGAHYKNKVIQPWDAIHEWGLGFFSGNVVKYVARHREKNGIEDLKKAQHYLNKLIEIMEGEK